MSVCHACQRPDPTVRAYDGELYHPECKPQAVFR